MKDTLERIKLLIPARLQNGEMSLKVALKILTAKSEKEVKRIVNRRLKKLEKKKNLAENKPL